ncbi:aldose 1-epimerase family protein [Microbacterium sediminicola]|uniref:Aldose 1-epimerase family protein n=1 Tax=Microbacterium sediminicola TaxID=415210 RepID=A0ABP4UJ65_9MICO
MVHEPTGEQYYLTSADGRVSAHLTQVGATIRGLTVDGVDAIAPYPLGMPAPAASGTVLVPWPNRIRDGKWSHDGKSYQLWITDPAYTSASHGLLRFMPYTVAEKASDRLTLAATVFPQSGYPFQLDTTVTYALTSDGIEVTHVITNVGADAAPVAVGTHPYFTVGDVPTEDLVLTSPGARVITIDDQLLPVGEVPVDASTDLRRGARLGDVDLNTTYTDLERDADGILRHHLRAPDGRTVTLWQGEGMDYAQVFTTDRYPNRPLAVAIEPMSAVPDAFNSGRGLRWLAPGESWTVSWGVTYSG